MTDASGIAGHEFRQAAKERPLAMYGMKPSASFKLMCSVLIARSRKPASLMR